MEESHCDNNFLTVSKKESLIRKEHMNKIIINKNMSFQIKEPSVLLYLQI